MIETVFKTSILLVFSVNEQKGSKFWQFQIKLSIYQYFNAILQDSAMKTLTEFRTH